MQSNMNIILDELSNSYVNERGELCHHASYLPVVGVREEQVEHSDLLRLFWKYDKW
jgi:hypothetical protein